MNTSRPRRAARRGTARRPQDATAATRYTLAELDESLDDRLGCLFCGATLEPGQPMTYGSERRGFGFYHPDCLLAEQGAGALVAPEDPLGQLVADWRLVLGLGEDGSTSIEEAPG